jgi:hypothetical protein
LGKYFVANTGTSTVAIVELARQTAGLRREVGVRGGETDINDNSNRTEEEEEDRRRKEKEGWKRGGVGVWPDSSSGRASASRL